jgi:transposase
MRGPAAKRTFIFRARGKSLVESQLEDAHRFRKSRDVGSHLGLQPGPRNSGQRQPQLHISKEGDPYLRTLLVQGAQPILGPFGADSDLRHWGRKLAAQAGGTGRNEPS